MKKVRNCFGQYGNKSCLVMECNDPLCKECYFGWWGNRRERLRDFIKRYKKKNHLK